MARSKPANTAKAGKRTIPKTAWKPGQSGNPAGAPKRGESWAEIIKRIGDMEPGEAAHTFGEIAKQLRNMPAGVTLKEFVVMRIYAAMLFEPSSSLWGHMLDRVDGKVKDEIDAKGDITIRVVRADRALHDNTDPNAT